MPSISNKTNTCVIIGSSHGGVNCAFNLRREGWEGRIVLFDADPQLPYHRPPLSKAYLTSEDGIEQNRLKPAASYKKEAIDLRLGTKVTAIRRKEKNIALTSGEIFPYDKLVIATGARPLIPTISGLSSARNVFTMRTAADSNAIRAVAGDGVRAVIIGGGYIGLETAASLRKLGAEVTVLEREERILARVTAPEMSAFFQELHTENAVTVLTGKNVVSVERGTGQNLSSDSEVLSKKDTASNDGVSVEHASNKRASYLNEVVCSDGTRYPADMIVVGVGIRVNTELAEDAGLSIENGIRVDASTKTSDDHIYAIGDCTFHHNPHYDRLVRLESVQNAIDQAKVAAANICGKDTVYDSIPWFWSDQYNVKLQMVGLSHGYDQAIMRKEETVDHCLSTWYFKGDELLAVDAVNNAKAYVYGTKFIKSDQKLDKDKLANPMTEFKPANLLV